MSTPLIPGRVYYGPGQQRLVLVSIEGGVAYCQWPISHDQRLMPLHEFEEWIEASDWRTYYHESGEVRTRRHLDLEAKEVSYHTLNHADAVTVPLKEWNEWRKGA